MAKIVGVSSCPAGIAHTYMAAEALEKAGRRLGHSIKMETQGAGGVENRLSSGDISSADLVIIAADVNVNRDRFVGKKVVAVSVGKAIREAEQVIVEGLSS